MTVERINDQIIFASNFNAQVIIGLIKGKIDESVNQAELKNGLSVA